MSRAAAPLQWLTMGLLAVGLLGLSPALSLSLLAFGLAVLTALKLREARSLEERRVVALLQLVCAGLLAALRPELAPSLLQGLAILMALAGLLALELGPVPTGRRCCAAACRCCWRPCPSPWCCSCCCPA